MIAEAPPIHRAGLDPPHPRRQKVIGPLAVVKVGDTVADVEEGLNAGVWTVGVTWTGNLIGLTQAELGALDRRDLERRTQAAEQTLVEAGAHYVIESFADLPAVVRQIEEQLQYGVAADS